MSSPTTPFADLHCHSTHSDGTMTPLEILDLAVEKGFKGFSITDHDTVAAYPEILPAAKEKGLEVITGVEFSCYHDEISVHILGYAFDLNAPKLLELIARHKTRRDDRNRAILAKLKKMGFHIFEEDLQAYGTVIGRPHIALELMKRGAVKTVKEAFNKYLAEGKSAYVPGCLISVEETIDIIHASKGKAVIAHPHLLDHPKTLQALLQMPFDGIETHYANFTPDKNKRWKDLAKRKGWLETGGSDFHGTIKPTLAYGASYVDETRFRRLQQPS